MLYLKALHIIFVVTWFAGLFYMVRLLIYHREAADKSDLERRILTDQFLIMEKRLWYGITWPSAILTLILGTSLLSDWMPLSEEPWLVAKLIFVAGLLLYHLSIGRIFKQFKTGNFSRWSSTKLRVHNELATIFLVAIVFLVELKNILSMGYGIAGLLLFAFVLILAIRVYKRIRE